MKIIWRFLLILAFVFVALGFTGEAYAGLYTYRSTLNVYNLEGDTANITMTFYELDGTMIDPPFSDTIPANDDKTFLNLSVPEGFNGSLVLSSDNQVTAISNLRGTLGDTTSDAAYVASDSGDDVMNIPLLQKNNGGLNWNSWFYVQNMGDASTTVSVQYTDIVTPVVATIAPGVSAEFDQSTESHSSSVFSAIVTASGEEPLAITVINEHADAIYAYSGVPTPVVNPVMPIINYQPITTKGWRTGVQIQNTSGASSDVTVTYTPTPGLGTACTETQTIPAESSRTFAWGAFNATIAGENCLDGERFVGSAKVTSNSTSAPLTVIVNQQRHLKDPASFFTGAYTGLDPAQATNTVIFPLIQDRNGAAQNFTGFNVMNVGTLSTTVECTFTGTTYTASGTVEPDQTLNAIQRDNISAAYVGSAICTATGGDELIVGVINQQANLITDEDRLLVSEGVNTITP